MWRVRGSTKLLHFILRGSWMSASHSMAIYPVVAKEFQSKLQMSTSWLHYSSSQGVTKVTRVHPHGTMNVRHNFCANTCSGCCNISQVKWQVGPAGGPSRGRVRGSTKTEGLILWGPWRYLDKSGEQTNTPKLPSNEPRCWQGLKPECWYNLFIGCKNV